MMANITFLSFLLFSMCYYIHVAVNIWLNCSFFYINSKIQAVQLAVHDNKLVVHLHCFAKTYAATAFLPMKHNSGGAKVCGSRDKRWSCRPSLPLSQPPRESGELPAAWVWYEALVESEFGTI